MFTEEFIEKIEMHLNCEFLMGDEMVYHPETDTWKGADEWYEIFVRLKLV